MKTRKINIGDKLISYVFRFSLNEEEWAIIIMVKDGLAIGLFTGNLDELGTKIPDYVFKCVIQKQKEPEKSSYFDLSFLDKSDFKVIIHQISRSFRNDFTNYSRKYSEKLEEGISVQDLITDVISKEILDQEDEIWRESIINALVETEKILETNKRQLSFKLESA